ncbi:hypothetical protein BC829DRAFT_399180 [Chytridium lagenaria]|nr:hypothetical protein BC829DRAFT_399180 [Chytridium lagenaria]
MNRLRRFSESFRNKSPIKERNLNFESEEKELPITISLGDALLSYENRAWLAEGSINQELLEKNKMLEGENQLLKYKLALMLDMLTSTKLDLLVSQKDGTVKSKPTLNNNNTTTTIPVVIVSGSSHKNGNHHGGRRGFEEDTEDSEEEEDEETEETDDS